jgi:recombination protein RecA
MAEDKDIEKLISEINKNMGDGSVIRFGEVPKKIDVIPTGILPLDVALDVGGMPRGRIVEMYGHEASGKTTLAQYIVAAAQRLGDTCAYVDMEHALDPVYAELCGVDVDKMLLSQPSSGEQALDIVESFVRSGKIGVVVVDSVSALVPQKELEGEMGDASVGLQARLMSQAMRKLSGVVKKSNTLLIFINQIRQKIGVLYGSPDTTSGGLALKFYSSIRMEIRRSTYIKEGRDNIGNEIAIKITKNKVGRPFKRARVALIYGKGIDKLGGMLDVALEVGTLERRGAYYYLYGEQIGQGKDAAIEFLQENDQAREKLEQLTVEKARETTLLSMLDDDDFEE